MEKFTQNHHPNCKPKITAHNQTQIAKEEEEEEEEERKRRKRKEKEKKKERVFREVMFGVCGKVGGVVGTVK